MVVIKYIDPVVNFNLLLEFDVFFFIFMVHAISTKTSLIYHRKAVSVEPTDRNIKAFCFFEFIAFSSTLNHLLKNFFYHFVISEVG